jgi:hypothetical protein
MPGPFPGMDPYLENPLRWPDLHCRFIVCLATELNAGLTPKYVACINEWTHTAEPPRMPHAYISVHLTADVHKDMEAGQALRATRAVTVITLMSPGYKSEYSPNRSAYLLMQTKICNSHAHLMEIDLLRGGAHTLALPSKALTKVGTFDYRVCLHRAGAGEHYETWSFLLSEPLPRIPVPLKNGDADIVIDLQAIFDRCYDAAGYKWHVDYSRTPDPPLKPGAAAWARTLLEQKGIL